jgi:hypothetical protein
MAPHNTSVIWKGHLTEFVPVFPLLEVPETMRDTFPFQLAKGKL